MNFKEQVFAPEHLGVFCNVFVEHPQMLWNKDLFFKIHYRPMTKITAQVFKTVIIK